MALDEGTRDPEDIIICRDMHKWYGDFHVLKGITTSVRRSEKVGDTGTLRVWQVNLHPDH